MSVLLQDGYNRADSAVSLGSADIGGAYTTGNVGDIATLPTWGISSNQAYLVANGSGIDRDAYLEAGSADGDLQVDIVTPTPIAGNQAGLVFRRQDGNNRFLARINNSTSLVQIRKILAAAQSTVIQATVTPNLVAGQTVNMKVSLSGTNILVYIDGVLWLTTSQTDFQTATKHGLYSVAAATPYRFDNLLMTSPAAAGPANYYAGGFAAAKRLHRGLN